MFVIIGKGEPSQKYVKKQSERVTPFIGADSKEAYAQLGVGVYAFDASGQKIGSFWGLCVPKNLLQSWRAMKLVEEASVISNGTLCAAWYCAQAEISGTNQHYRHDMAQKFSSAQRFDSIRNNVLQSVPDEKELSSMLRVVRDNNFRLSDLEDIQKAIADKPYPESRKILAVLVQREAEDMARWEQDEAARQSDTEAKPSVPKKETWIKRLFGGLLKHNAR